MNYINDEHWHVYRRPNPPHGGQQEIGAYAPRSTAAAKAKDERQNASERVSVTVGPACRCPERPRR